MWNLCVLMVFLIVSVLWSSWLSASVREGSLALGLCKTFYKSWFFKYDANMMSLARMSIWIAFANLSLHFWFLTVFEDIGNALTLT